VGVVALLWVRIESNRSGPTLPGIARKGSGMANRVTVAPQMVEWARRRSGRDITEFRKKFPRLAEWEAGESQPTMTQLEDFARATYTPVGFLFLAEPPVETLSIPDFRTFGDRPVPAPSPDLLDTIYASEQRQEWYREFAQAHGEGPVELVGSLNIDVEPTEAATRLRDALGFGLARRVEFTTWSDALDGLREHAEDAGVLVMINGVVGANTHRKLDPEEFRGFALADRYAPVVFINGADTKAAQIFSLGHELAHIALGESAVSKADMAELIVDDATERWCNQVAAELLVPIASLRQEYAGGRNLVDQLQVLAKLYKVSTLVVLRRLFDAELVDRPTYVRTYGEELDRVLTHAAGQSSGGNFYNTTPVRVSKRFARALIADTLEGRTSHRDAFRLLGSKKYSAFEGLGRQLGVA
jgi:Zn-dependent peptidase ImmA (M78 family)